MGCDRPEPTVYEREKLYQEVWAEPVQVVAERYGVSGVALAKGRRDDRLGVSFVAQTVDGARTRPCALGSNLVRRDVLSGWGHHHSAIVIDQASLAPSPALQPWRLSHYQGKWTKEWGQVK